MNCYYCDKKINNEYVEVFSLGFAAYKIGDAHKECYMKKQRQRNIVLYSFWFICLFFSITLEILF